MGEGERVLNDDVLERACRRLTVAAGFAARRSGRIGISWDMVKSPGAQA